MPNNIYKTLTSTVEKIYNNNPLFLREREAININKFNVKDQGMNKYSWANCNPFLKIFFLALFTHIYPHSAVYTWQSPEADCGVSSRKILWRESL